MTIYPAPRWFREVVLAWLDATAPRERDRKVDVLFTQLVRKQPPMLHVAANDERA